MDRLTYVINRVHYHCDTRRKRTLDHTLFVINYIVPVSNTHCLYYINVDNRLLCNEFLLATERRLSRGTFVQLDVD